MYIYVLICMYVSRFENLIFWGILSGDSKNAHSAVMWQAFHGNKNCFKYYGQESPDHNCF